MKTDNTRLVLIIGNHLLVPLGAMLMFFGIQSSSCLIFVASVTIIFSSIIQIFCGELKYYFEEMKGQK